MDTNTLTRGIEATKGAMTELISRRIFFAAVDKPNHP